MMGAMVAQVRSSAHLWTVLAGDDTVFMYRYPPMKAALEWSVKPCCDVWLSESGASVGHPLLTERRTPRLRPHARAQPADQRRFRYV